MSVVVDDHDFRLYCGDLLDVLALQPDLKVDAIVTSPPYLDVRDDVASFGHTRYLGWADRWLDVLSWVIEPTGSMMLNLGRVHRDGEELLWHYEVLQLARRYGWRLVDTIVWHKVNGGGGRALPYLLDRHEYVFWLAQDPPNVYKGFDEARVPYSEATVGRYTRKWKSGGGAVKGKVSAEQDGRTLHPDGAKAGSVFVSSVGAEKGIDHPTPMAPELAEHLVKLSCPVGGIVLDPFAGSGTTALAARKLGRRSIGVDVDPTHCEEAAARLSQQTLEGGS